MIDRFVTIIGATLIILTVAEPAMAGLTTVPEPTTMSLFGLGVAGAFIAKRLAGRK